MAQSSYQLINLISNITLTWPSSFSGGPVVLDINDINPDQNNREIILPDTTLVQVGQNFVFNNVSGFSFKVMANDGTTLLITVTSGEIIQMYLTGNSTANGVWRIIPWGGGSNAITQFTAESTDSSITITNGTVTPPSGVIDFQLPTSLYNLNKIDSTDLMVVTQVSPSLTFRTVELVGGENILISNGDGIEGNPIIDLNPTVSSLNSITLKGLTISGEIITSNVTDGNIQLNTNGTGKIYLNGASIDVNGNIDNVTNLVSPKAYCSFSDTLTGDGNTIVIGDKVNVASVTGSGGTYVINFTTPMPTINYGVITTLGSTGGSLPFISNAYYIVRQTTSVTIIVTDASGELVLSVPNGISMLIMSS